MKVAATEKTFRGKRKWKSKSSEQRILLHADNVDSISSLLLAAISTGRKPNSLIKKCLSKLRVSLLSHSPTCSQTLLNATLSVTHLLLRSNCAEIRCLACEIVGAASLLSLEMNELIASDGEILRGLISVFGRRPTRRILKAACDAVLDLSTTSIGRLSLLEFSAVELLLFSFLQAPKSTTLSVFICDKDNESCTSPKIGFMEDELSVLLLNAAIILINSCILERLEKIPKSFCQFFLSYLKCVWAQVRSQMFFINANGLSQEKQLYMSNISTNDLTESIFRLSVTTNPGRPLPFENVKANIFGSRESSFKEFILNYWEICPFLVRRQSTLSSETSDTLSKFVQHLNSAEEVDLLFDSLLQNLVSCHPIASDELDILNFLQEVRNKLGFPIMYEQDMRVLRTDRQLKREEHFFRDGCRSCCSMDPHVFNSNDVVKCAEAYSEGFTFALRGMEFRFENIAATTDVLASLFGQPSIGANMYLTPPDSQGLACHSDDHCVFVCQLFGSKKWTVFFPPKMQLPSLYDSLDSMHDSEGEGSLNICGKYLLKEGDILYIPRGFPHEAYTENGGPAGSPGFSLHITFGVEVEPPFEWEGFAHVAFHSWRENQGHCLASSDSLSGTLFSTSTDCLHLAIQSVGDSDPLFRKACLIAAANSPSDTSNWLDMNQRLLFSQVLEKIEKAARFLEVVRKIESAAEKNEDPFERMAWLRHLDNQEGGRKEEEEWRIPFMGIENLHCFLMKNRDEMEALFSQVISSFCKEVPFGNAVESYKRLLGRYRKVREQYTVGMISLHQ